VIVKRVHPHLAKTELLTIMWFVLSKFSLLDHQSLCAVW